MTLLICFCLGELCALGALRVKSVSFFRRSTFNRRSRAARNSQLSTFPSHNSFPCHTSEKSARKSNHCHTSKISLLQALCLPHIRPPPAGGHVIVNHTPAEASLPPA